MKKIILMIAFLLSFNSIALAYTTWENNPANWENSSTNWDNNSMNWKNSPKNWNNNPMNPNANVIYDNKGNPQGYAVPKGNGKGVNIYNFEGDRQGYYNY